jgi:hypothetical protein
MPSNSSLSFTSCTAAGIVRLEVVTAAQIQNMYDRDKGWNFESFTLNTFYDE